MEVVSKVLHAEAQECIAGLQAALDWGMQNIILETDLQVLVKALQSDDYDRSTGGVFFWDAKLLLALFASVSVTYSPRSCNRVAHELASAGNSRDRMIRSFGFIPSLILY